MMPLPHYLPDHSDGGGVDQAGATIFSLRRIWDWVRDIDSVIVYGGRGHSGVASLSFSQGKLFSREEESRIIERGKFEERENFS